MGHYSQTAETMFSDDVNSAFLMRRMLLDKAVEIGFKILRRWETSKQNAEKLPTLEDTFPASG